MLAEIYFTLLNIGNNRVLSERHFDDSIFLHSAKYRVTLLMIQGI